MNFRREKKGDNLNSVDFTPIVDTVFNLIIFFALSLNFIGMPAIKLKLPQASTEETVKEKNEIRIYVTKGISRDGYTYGNFIIEGKDFTLDDLEKLIYQRAVNKDTIVVIQADESVSQGEIVKIMDIAKSAGLDRIAIATKPKEK